MGLFTLATVLICHLLQRGGDDLHRGGALTDHQIMEINLCGLTRLDNGTVKWFD